MRWWAWVLVWFGLSAGFGVIVGKWIRRGRRQAGLYDSGELAEMHRYLDDLPRVTAPFGSHVLMRHVNKWEPMGDSSAYSSAHTFDDGVKMEAWAHYGHIHYLRTFPDGTVERWMVAHTDAAQVTESA